MNTETIFALSSGHGKSGIAVIRISGTDLYDDCVKMIGRTGADARHAYLTNLLDNDGALIDQCVILYFKAPYSFTGEDVIEIHSHGAPAVIQKIFEFLRKRGARMAMPGEFSKRAFYNNKMNLVEIDGLAALLDARTDRQRAMALKSMTGNDTAVYEHWRTQMIEIAAYSAAILDYSDDDLPQNIGQKLSVATQKLSSEIKNAVTGYSAARAIQGGFNIALVGDTNVGKSSLFNRLVGSARAIVSDIPGTTRDVVSQDLDIDGYLVHLSDTAGLRESNDAIEKIGIERTHATVSSADLILRIYGAPTDDIAPVDNNEIIVFNKSDLIQKNNFPHSISVSALTGNGVAELLELIKIKIHDLTDASESDIAVNNRTKSLLMDAEKELSSAVVISDGNYDIFAEHVRRAADTIGKILGVIDANEVADAIFGQLCLGK